MNEYIIVIVSDVNIRLVSFFVVLCIIMSMIYINSIAIE